MATSYSNPEGSGNRQTTILITVAGLNGNGLSLIDGTTASGPNWLTSSTGCSFEFWFPSKKIIDEAKFYQSGTQTHGTWQWSGSQDRVNWTNIGGTFTLGGATVQTITTPLSGNTTAYVFYRVVQTAGTASSGPNLFEWEFKLEDGGPTSYKHALGSGNRTASITLTASGITAAGGGALTTLLDGNRAAGTFWNAAANAGHWLTFDFGASYVVQQARFYLSNISNQGDWKFQGSTNNSTWVDLSPTFTMGLKLVTVIGGFESNVTSYRYYRLLGVSGSRTNTPSEWEIEFLSGAPLLVTVPNVVGLTQAAATTAITGAGLTLGTVTPASSTTVAAGLVISQTPAAAASVTVGSAVALTVSTGPPMVTVPNVVGLSEAAATTAITGAGLVKGTVTLAASITIAAGLVSDQSPAAGGTAVVGSAVTLVISTGPPPWDLTIAGVSHKSKVLQHSVSIRLESGERSSVRFSVTRVGGYLPARFETVQVTDKAGAVMFAGPILSRVIEAVVPNHHTVAVEASDWWAYLDWALVNLTFTTPVTTKAILLALVAALPAGYGFTVASAQADGLTYDAYASGADAKASDVVRGLAKDLKWRPAVSAAKVIGIAPAGSVAAPWTLTTANPHCRSARWHDPTGTPANRIILRCGPSGVGDPVTVSWIGDGVTRVFSLDARAVPSSSVRVNICFIDGVQLPVWPPGEGPPDHIEWDYTLNSGTLTFIGTSPWHPPAVGAVIVLTYWPQFPFTVVAASGATPVISEIYTDTSITVYDQGVARAEALLAERNQPAARELEVLSRDDGWRPDQGITVALDAIDFTGTGTIGPVTISLTTVDEWLYTFTAVETTTVPATGLELWRKLFQGSSGGGSATPVGGSGGGGLAQLTGDVTAGPATGVAVATIANDAVTYAKVQNVSGASKLLGRGSAGGAGDVEELTLGTGLSITGTTINGPRNSALVNYSYNTGAEPPTAGQVRTDNGFPWTATTKLWVRFVSVDDEDVYWGIMILSIGSAILLQDKDSHTSYARFVTTGAPIDKGLYAEIPVAWVANGSSIISGQQVLLQATAVSAVVQRRQVLVVLDGGGAVLTAGTRTFVSLPVGGTWKKWRIVSVDNAATAGSIVIDVWRDTYANYPPTVADTITASAKPTMTAASKAESATLTGWTTAFAAGDVLGFNVDSATTVTKVELVLEFE